jgi:hypothetical protein
MKCNRLKTLVKNWYLHVQNEAMAPARMVELMTKHISLCEECIHDPDVKAEADKIREIVLPPSKVPKPKERNTDTEELEKEVAEEDEDTEDAIDNEEDEEDDEEEDDEEDDDD